MTMKWLVVPMVVGFALSVGACHRKEAPKVEVKTVKEVVAPKVKVLSLESLDARVSGLERSRAAARAAMKQHPVQGF